MRELAGKKSRNQNDVFGGSVAALKAAAEVVAMLDGNVKELGKDDPKLHSLALSRAPSSCC